jgi:hypothetical protein
MTAMQNEEICVFVQLSRMGMVTFERKGCQLLVVGKRGPVKINLDVDLRDIAPHVERKRWRSLVMIGFPLFFAGVTALITWALRWQQFVPYPLVVIAGILFAIGFISVGIRNIAPFEVVTFRSHSGVPVFDVYKETKQAAEFEAFVSSLVTVIRSQNQSQDVGS